VLYTNALYFDAVFFRVCRDFCSKFDAFFYTFCRDFLLSLMAGDVSAYLVGSATGSRTKFTKILSAFIFLYKFTCLFCINRTLRNELQLRTYYIIILLCAILICYSRSDYKTD